MLSFVKINLNGGLKRLVSTLICLMMVLATFPMHMISSTVSAAEQISLELGSAGSAGTGSPGNGSEVSGWMNSQLSEANIAGKGDITIKLTNSIEVASGYSPTMNASASTKYFFDFTDDRFDGKTITIDGKGKTIKIEDENLFFLNLKNCRVILKNITIDGGWKGLNDGETDVAGGVERSGSFINVSQPTGGKSSKLEIEEGTTIQNCKNSSIVSHGGAIFNAANGQLIINGGIITNCSANSSSTSTSAPLPGSNGGAIYNDKSGQVIINDGNITGCSCYSVKDSCGGAIFNNGGVLTINGGNITDCKVEITDILAGKAHGGAIDNFTSGTLTINGGSIIDCTSAKNGDAIYNHGTLNLPPKELGVFKIQLPDAYDSSGHNSALNDVMYYEGIYSGKDDHGNTGTTQRISNIKTIVFVDSESNSPVGLAVGVEGDVISVPTRPGYEFAGDLSYTKDGTKTDVEVNNGKFTLNNGILAAEVCGVVPVKVVYNKLYIVQYICDNKMVGIRSGCSAGTDLSAIINTDLSKIILDGGKTLANAVKLGAGYRFLQFTYGINNVQYVEGTTWGALTASEVDGVITVILHYTGSSQGTAQGASDVGHLCNCHRVKYVASRHVILDKRSKLANYSGVNLPVSGLQEVPAPKNIIFDFCGNIIHHNDPDVPFIKTLPGQHITICNLTMDGSGCKYSGVEPRFETKKCGGVKPGFETKKCGGVKPRFEKKKH